MKRFKSLLIIKFNEISKVLINEKADFISMTKNKKK